MLYRSETCPPPSSFGSSQPDWILVFIMIFIKALKLKFAYLSENALISFSFCRKSHRGQAQQAGVCSPAWECDDCRWSNLLGLNKGFWWFGIAKSWTSPAALWPLYYIRLARTSLDVLLLSELPQIHIPVIRWQTFCTFVLMGFSSCTISQRRRNTVVKTMGIVSNHTQVASWS